MARALGLRLRVEGGAVGEWLRGFEARLPVRPVLQPGEAVDEEQQARLREWNGAHLGAFDALLAASSAIHPLDALQRVPPGRRRVYRANWAADVVCGIRISDVSTADQRALLALRRRRREALALHAGRAKEARAEIVGRTSAWAAQPDGAIDAGLETALVDERIIPWLQVELLDRNAQ